MGKIIYHYCNVESFRAIIQNKTLWLSSVYNLNDYKEIHWIKEKVLKKIEKNTTKNSFDKYSAFEKIYNQKLPNVYIASFSQGNDLLSQWRAYANDGHGVAIGFNTDYFKENRLITTSVVLYDESKQEELIDNILEPINLLDDNIDVKSTKFINICETVINDINNLSAKSKNELFKEEQEVRLIHSPTIIDNPINRQFVFKDNISQMKFRAVCGNLIPYFELKFEKMITKTPAIVEIIKGPKNRFIDQEIKIFLSINGFYDVKIKKSKSSYR
ncbi:hypothetical protein GCM10012288_07800 [Malaciobacter pacificus]|uniref:DUF2971 domain-containing protein n=1 Tax=Malaciobacter pacificus TaxID=1080223 RepID=A0A5C2H9Z8_9BACT|nr:DUF2971 domain-containing protein [Malaciobacter pacificus]QEP35169.1 DUF2971 domain-containing protein [Malaciobacter pacificus]GGD36233.1 hypothetical protein GCM10012288_07800 [Malaciobacter pacificus]